MNQRIARGLAAGFVMAALALAWSGAASAGEPSLEQRRQFLETICAGTKRVERCLSAGHLVEGISLDWILFEACSASGPRDEKVRCFDKAHPIAAELTDDPRYAERRRFCNRFAGEKVDEMKMLCYRADFKYTRENTDLHERSK